MKLLALVFSFFMIGCASNKKTDFYFDGGSARDRPNAEIEDQMYRNNCDDSCTSADCLNRSPINAALDLLFNGL